MLEELGTERLPDRLHADQVESARPSGKALS